VNALVIIDMLNGFCRPGFPLSLPGSTTRLESYVAERIEASLEVGDMVIFVCDSHKMDDPEIGRPYPIHCLEGTSEARIIDSLQKFEKHSIILAKRTLSIFLGTGLESVLEKARPEVVEVTGVCTDICDLFAVYELRIRGYSVFVSQDGVLALHPEEQVPTLQYMESHLGARVEYAHAIGRGEDRG